MRSSRSREESPPRIPRGAAASLARLLTACAGKAEPAKPAGFSATDMQSDPSLPFHRVWHDSSFTLAERHQLFVAAVDTDYLMDHTWWQGFGRGSKAHADAVELAVEFRDLVLAAFANDPAHRFTVIDEAAIAEHRDDALALELAIVELVPNKALIQTLSYPAGPFGLLARQGMDRLGATSIAIEGRVRDLHTGKVVACFADREQKKAGLLNVKNFTWYGHVREILGEWAEQFRRIASREAGEVIPDTPAFRLLPW